MIGVLVEAWREETLLFFLESHHVNRLLSFHLRLDPLGRLERGHLLSCLRMHPHRGRSILLFFELGGGALVDSALFFFIVFFFTCSFKMRRAPPALRPERLHTSVRRLFPKEGAGAAKHLAEPVVLGVVLFASVIGVRFFIKLSLGGLDPRLLRLLLLSGDDGLEITAVPLLALRRRGNSHLLIFSETKKGASGEVSRPRKRFGWHQLKGMGVEKGG